MSTEQTTSPPLTPCIGICQVDPAAGLCSGCYRTLEEIGRWGGMDDGERRAIMADLPARAARSGGAA